MASDGAKYDRFTGLETEKLFRTDPRIGACNNYPWNRVSTCTDEAVSYQTYVVSGGSPSDGISENNGSGL